VRFKDTVKNMIEIDHLRIIGVFVYVFIDYRVSLLLTMLNSIASKYWTVANIKLEVMLKRSMSGKSE
jgi:ACT domain-containing protein